MQEGKKQRIEFLDYLKAVCVIMVIITHYGWEDKTSPFFTMLINMAVPVFMIVSGYNFAMSNRKKADGNLEKMYGWNMMKPKLIRFLLPFFAICLLEILLLAAQDKNIPLFRIFVLGAYGPGSYYVPIMLQLLVIFPLIYVMIAYNAKLGLAVAALANLAFEVCVIVFDMDKYYYRLSIGRYLLLIAFGCYLYLHPEQRVKPYQMWMMFLAGLAYLIADSTRISSCLATGRRQRCRLRSIFSRSLFYCSGNFITVRFRDLRGDCSHRLEKLPIISS